MCCIPWCRADVSSSLLQAKTAFERAVPKQVFHDYSIAFGDLNGDGVTDFVTFIGDPDYGDKGVENLRIAVFLGGRDDTFSLAGISSEILGHERVNHVLAIRRQSIFLQRDGPGGCCYHWMEQFQFKTRGGQIELIGVELQNDHVEGTAGEDTGSSANLITGQVIKWTGTGKHKHVQKTTMPNLKPVALADFNYQAFSEKWLRLIW
jgi:hypothetical protein